MSFWNIYFLKTILYFIGDWNDSDDKLYLTLCWKCGSDIEFIYFQYNFKPRPSNQNRYCFFSIFKIFQNHEQHLRDRCGAHLYKVFVKILFPLSLFLLWYISYIFFLNVCTQLVHFIGFIVFSYFCWYF